MAAGCFGMELKYAVLFVTGLCIVFIVVEQLFQSRSYSSHWNNPKSRLVASTKQESLWAPATNFKNNVGDAESPPSHRDKGGWIEEDDVDHQVRDETREDDNVWSMKRWNEWNKKNNKGKPKAVNVPGPRNGKKNTRKVWQEDSDDLDEEEKLRISPYIYRVEEEMERLKTPIIEKEVKYISHFLPWEQSENKKHGFRTCRYKKCAFIENDMTKADLVAFKAGNIRDHDILTFQRPPGQRWLMYTIDPAIRGYNLGQENMRSLFNATMTYNLDADIQQIFGRLKKVPPSTDVDYERIYDGKTKTAAWFVSHCVTPSRREEYVKRMQTRGEIDVFGECGTMSCGGGLHSRSNDAHTCLPLLTSDYKFYLAFENAFCMDYVTEKFFKLFENVQIIPVVRGGFQYKKYLPSGIFVNADDFKSPEALSEYLIELGNDKERYTAMLRKKDEWRLVGPEFRSCLLCEYLHSNPPNKFYPNLQEKFGRSSCWYPKEL